ncbi:MAG TPA: hypothetical protein VFI59_01310 [Actinomycetota bacterium]|nr:hypothetical protein [Actinomycetota bacterium]
MAATAGSVRHLSRAAVAVCLIVAVAGPAGAGVIDRDTGYDPRDIEPERDFQPPDVSSTTRRLAAVDGRRIVAIVVRYYVRSATGRVNVRIDASGGRRVDHRMLIAAFADPGCWIWPKGDRDARVTGKVGWRSERVACRVAARFFEPDKAIRWKVLAEASDGGFEPDFAPDHRGWYS